jgi:hypothetical protein
LPTFDYSFKYQQNKEKQYKTPFDCDKTRLFEKLQGFIRRETQYTSKLKVRYLVRGRQLTRPR